MKKIDRSKLRGKPLDDDCNKARRSTNERGPLDNRVFCYGLINAASEELLPKCQVCKAHVYYEEETLDLIKDELHKDCCLNCEHLQCEVYTYSHPLIEYKCKITNKSVIKLDEVCKDFIRYKEENTNET